MGRRRSDGGGVGISSDKGAAVEPAPGRRRRSSADGPAAEAGQTKTADDKGEADDKAGSTAKRGRTLFGRTDKDKEKASSPEPRASEADSSPDSSPAARGRGRQ